jgi:hypothetical protein
VTVAIKRPHFGDGIMGIINKSLAAAAASAMLASSANAACWTDAAYQAAQVRELDTMLMVQALRCRKTSATFLGEYNRFVQVSRPALLRANAELKAHFGGLNAYDNYMTTVANRYGAGTGDLDLLAAEIGQAQIGDDIVFGFKDGGHGQSPAKEQNRPSAE